MARIEKLSNDFNEPLSVNETPRSDADGNSMLEEMYNNCLAKKGADKDERNAKSFEQVMKELSRTPLFMNNLGDVADADAGMQKFSDHGGLSANAEKDMQMVRTRN